MGRLRWLRSNEVRLALGLGLLSACLRLPPALTRPFWQDEVASARILQEHSFGGAIRHVIRTESTPPLWYAVGWLVHRAGIPVFDVRLLSVAANAALVAVVVLVAAQVLPLRFAALAGALVAVGAEFSAEGRWIRAYELFALLTVALVVVLRRAAASATPARLSAVATVAGAGLLTHYFFLFTFAAAIVWLAVEPEARTVRGRILGALLAGLIPLAIWSPAFLEQYEQRRYSWIGPFEWREVVETPLRLFTAAGSGAAVLAGAVASVVACAVGFRLLWQRGVTGRLCVILAVVPLVMAAAVWAAGVRVYAVRNMIEVGPFLAVALAAALSALPRPVRTLVPAVVLAAACASFGWAQSHQGPEYQQVARQLVAEGWRPGDAVAVFGNRSEFRSPLEWYLPGRPQLATTVASGIDEPVFVVRSGSHLVVSRLPLRRLRLDRRLLRGANLFLSSSRRHSSAA